MRDPIENVTRLQKQLNNLQLENQVLKNILDKAGLSYQNELASIRKKDTKEDFDPEQGKRIVYPKEITDRMAKLFFSFFWGRTDVYAKRNVNKNGEAAYYPQCDNFWSDNCHRKLNTNLKLPWMQLQSIILKLMGVAIILTSCGFYLAGSMTLQNCIGMIICSFLVFESLGSAGNYSTLLRIVDLSVSKVENVMRIKEMDTDGKNIIPKNFDIEVENVDFYYDENHAEDAKIINHLSVHIPERTTTAIVGPSGGGKTTLCHLISRFWDVSNGNISLGGENVRNYSVDSLMKNFSFVFQNVYLFEDTIANNIRFGQPEASMKLVMDAAKKACCHDFIMELPNGYDTVIGEGGTSLSGGEKQRISIARAIMKDAPVIILDEATANVDPENEKELMSAIEALTKEKTIIMIAHRLKTVEHADQILVLDKGQIVQQGRHSELLKQTGIYRKFILEREEAVGWKI